MRHRVRRSRGWQHCLHRSGFSLFEVLLALALVVALGTVMFGFLNNLLSARLRVVEATAQHRAVTALFERLEHDLCFTLVGGGDRGPGVRGDATSLALLSRGQILQSLADGDVDAAFGDLQRTVVRFDSDARRISIGRGVARPSAGSTPNRSDDAESDSRFTGATGAPEGDASESAEPESNEIDGPIWRVRFRYHDGESWGDSFDSVARGRLPIAVEVAVWLRPWPGESWEEDQPPVDPALERLTFDTEPVFDDQAWAERPNRDFGPEPRPDRVRVITVPDAREEERQ